MATGIFARSKTARQVSRSSFSLAQVDLVVDARKTSSPAADVTIQPRVSFPEEG